MTSPNPSIVYLLCFNKALNQYVIRSDETNKLSKSKRARAYCKIRKEWITFKILYRGGKTDCEIEGKRIRGVDISDTTEDLRGDAEPAKSKKNIGTCSSKFDKENDTLKEIRKKNKPKTKRLAPTRTSPRNTNSKKKMMLHLHKTPVFKAFRIARRCQHLFQ